MDERNNYLYHFGVPGMKWGVRRDRKSFNTKYRPVSTFKTSHTSTREYLDTVDGKKVNYKNKNQRKAAKIAMKEGWVYANTFKGRVTAKDQLSVMGNKYVETLKELRSTKKAKKKIKSLFK